LFFIVDLFFFFNFSFFFSIIKQFASNKDDKRRVEKALDVSGLPSGKGDSLPIAKFQYEDFYNLYKNLTQRTEVEKIFDEL
jgi:phosphatidylinositol phospholipase C, beta